MLQLTTLLLKLTLLVLSLYVFEVAIYRLNARYFIFMRAPPRGIALNWPEIFQPHDWFTMFCLASWQNVSQVVVTSEMCLHVFWAQGIGVIIILLHLFFVLTLLFWLASLYYIVESGNTLDHLFVRNEPWQQLSRLRRTNLVVEKVPY